MHTSINLRVCSWFECLRERLFLSFDFYVLMEPVNLVNRELASGIGAVMFLDFSLSLGAFLKKPKL